MAVEVQPRTLEAHVQERRRLNRDTPVAVPIDKARVLARLQAQLAVLQADQEVTHGDD